MSELPKHPHEETLSQLEAEIDSCEVDEQRGQALGEIKAYLQLLRDEPEGEHQEPLRERLEDVVTLFDAEHHGLVASIQQAIAVLSTAGV